MDFSAFKPLPTGQSDFPGIREDGAVYVDKTRLIAELACRRGRFFLARPRRLQQIASHLHLQGAL